MNYVRINGTSFDAQVAISDYEEYFEVLDGPNVGRVTAGSMQRDIIGTYIGHKVTFFSGKSTEAFNALWDYLLVHSVDDFVWLEAADGQKEIAYMAYYTSGSRKLKSVGGDGINHWDEISVHFVPIDAAIRPK